MIIRHVACQLSGHRFSGDAALGEKAVRLCERCGLARGLPPAPHPEDRTARALAKIAAAAGHEVRGKRAGGNDRFRHRVLAEADREVARRIMRNTAQEPEGEDQPGGR